MISFVSRVRISKSTTLLYIYKMIHKSVASLIFLAGLKKHKVYSEGYCVLAFQNKHSILKYKYRHIKRKQKYATFSFITKIRNL